MNSNLGLTPSSTEAALRAVRAVVIGVATLSALVAFVGCGSDEAPGGGAAAGVTCAIDSDCPSGQKCVGTTCQAGFIGGDVVGGGDVDATDGSAAATDGVSADGASTSDTVTTSPGGSCGACKVESECNEGFACVPLLNTTDHNFCLKKCSDVSECSAGMVCAAATSASQTFCVPPTYECKGCAVTGCVADESCDFAASTPICIGVGKACAPCQLNKDCATGMVCVKQGDDKVCAPDCSGGTSCPANSACVGFGAGITACSYTASKCCFGETCTAATACAGCAGKCVAGACVECLGDKDCTEGTCSLATHTCIKDKCPDDKPNKLVTGECVECTNQTHCAQSSKGPNCIANTCAPSTQNNECSVCKAPYPGCVEINGNWSCVECAADDDCKATDKGTCSPKTYTCSGTTQGTGPSKGECKTDADCPAGTTGFDLACDTKTGLCYDKKGQCDNIAAFCDAAAGSTCKPFDGLGLGGAGLPQIPGLPGSGGGSGPATSGAGVCSCGATSSGGASWDDSLCKLFQLTACDCAKDSTSAACDPLKAGSCCQQSGGGGSGNPLSMLACLSALQGGKPDPVCFGGGSCLDMSCLTSAMGGGGAASGGGGYCTAP